MDILIKGMEMPKTCRRCMEMEIPVRCRVMEQEAVTAVMSGYNRPSDCPLVEIPPHGELIDKQEALKGLIIAMDCVSCRHPDDCSWCSVNEWQDVIRNAPTVLEASNG